MILFRKCLMMDTDPIAFGRAKLILKENGIPFEEKTFTAENSMSRSFNAAAAVRYASSYSDMSAQTYVYKLFVPARCFSEAKKLVFGSN